MKKVIILVLLFICFYPSFPQSNNYWEEITLPTEFQKSFFLDAFFLNNQPQFGWICGQNGEVLRTIDSGKTWQGIKILKNNYGADLESVMFANPKVGYVSGSEGIFKSIDSGKTFVDVTPYYNSNLSITFWGCYLTDENNVWLIGGGCPNISDLANNKPSQHFYKSSDGGNSWIEKSYCVEGNALCDLVMYGKDSLGYASSSGGVWRTLDGGLNWSLFTTTGSYSWEEDMCVYKSSFLVPISFGCLGSFDPGAMRMSTDLGKTWVEKPAQGAMFGTFLLSETKGWAVGQKQSVYYTEDGGQNWELRNNGISGDLDDIWFINDTTAFAVGNKVYKLNYSGVPLQVEDFVLDQSNIYPNPANDVVNIKNIGLGESFYSIIDINGEILFTSDRFNSTQQQISIDFTNYQIGIYLLKLNCEGKLKTYKVIKN